MRLEPLSVRNGVLPDAGPIWTGSPHDALLQHAVAIVLAERLAFGEPFRESERVADDRRRVQRLRGMPAP